MAIKKLSKGTVILGCIGIILLIAVGYGVRTFVQHVNGTSSAQIEARQRANEAADQTTQSLNEQSQWYQDMMSEPVTVTNSEGETVTYSVQAAPCINSSESD